MRAIAAPVILARVISISAAAAPVLLALIDKFFWWLEA
jgi:hypothetical protein